MNIYKMYKCKLAFFAILLMAACSNDDTEMTAPKVTHQAATSPTDDKNTLSDKSREAAKRLVGKWKKVYSHGWTFDSLKKLETDSYHYLQFYDDGRFEWSEDTLQWYATDEVRSLQAQGYKAMGYQVRDDWGYDENSHALSGHVDCAKLIGHDNAFASDGTRYYMSFVDSDAYELFVIEDPEDRINCFSYGSGYVRVE